LNKEEFISSGLLELYAMRVSSPEETQIVEETLKQFPELKQELEDIEISLEKYARENAIEPPVSAKERLFSRVFPEKTKEENKRVTGIPINKKSETPMFYKWIAAASIILLIGSIIVNYSYYEKYHDAKQELLIAEQKIEQQQKSNLAMSRDMEIVTNKYAEPVVLKGTPKAPDAMAKIFWMKNTGDVYINPTNLPQAPAGKQYQLWAIVDGTPVNGGMIVTEKGTYHIQKMKSFGKAQAFAITLEKTGGSPTPTMSEMVVIAKM
jgi:anti-sigma-K factor RskA